MTTVRCLSPPLSRRLPPPLSPGGSVWATHKTRPRVDNQLKADMRPWFLVLRLPAARDIATRSTTLFTLALHARNGPAVPLPLTKLLPRSGVRLDVDELRVAPCARRPPRDAERVRVLGQHTGARQGGKARAGREQGAGADADADADADSAEGASGGAGVAGAGRCWQSWVRAPQMRWTSSPRSARMPSMFSFLSPNQPRLSAIRCGRLQQPQRTSTTPSS